MNKYIWFICLALFLVVSGCTKSKEQPKTQAESNKQNITLEDLDQRLRNLELDNLFKDFEKIAFITVSEKKFATIKSEIGTIAFVVDDIKPYANGSNLKLIIGNPLNATLSNVKFKIDYGQLDEKNTPINESQKTKEVALLKPLRQGRWNKEEIVLGGLKPENLGYVRIHDFNFESMFLNQ